MFRIEKKKEFSSKTLTSICLLSHFSLASMALSRRLERITVISVGSMVSADKSLTLNRIFLLEILERFPNCIP